MKPLRFHFRLFVLTCTVVAVWGVSERSIAAFAQTSAVASPSSAQTTRATPTEDQIRSLIATIKDEASRKRLIEQIEGLLAAKRKAETPAPRRAGARFIDLASQRINRASTEIVAVAAFLVDMPRLTNWVGRQFKEEGRREFWVRFAWQLALILLGGLIAAWIVRVTLVRPRRAIESRREASVWLRSWYLIYRTSLDLIPLAVFAMVAYVILPMTGPDKATGLVALAVINAIVIARAVIAAARALLAPTESALRLFAISDETAIYQFIWFQRFANIAVYGYFLAEAALLLGVPQGGYHTLRVIVGFLIVLFAIMFILQNRDAAAAWIRGDTTEPSIGSARLLRRRFADVWHVLAIIYVVLVFGVWALDIENASERIVQGSILSVIIIAIMGLLSRLVERLVMRVLSVGKELSDRFPGIEARADRYFGIVRHTVRGAIIIIGVSALLQAWGINSFAWIATDFGQRVMQSIMIIAMVLVASILVWEFVNSAVERYLSAGSEGSAEVSARAVTLLPLFRSVLTIVLATLVVMIALSELGVNIGPLLAGAGVVGLAVGFGAQTLVKDVITGFFILSEDQIAVGDVVQVGSHAGLVEGLTLRTVRLRDLAGNVHIIPFSAVTTVENMTKEFSRYVFDVGVAYREDTDEVVEVLKAIGEEMVADPYFGELIVAPLEILGVDKFADSAVVIKARITTKPIKQWEVGREFNRRMKKRFDEMGIEIPFPHRTVYFGVDKSGEAPAAHLRIDGEEGTRSRQIDSLGHKQ